MINIPKINSIDDVYRLHSIVCDCLKEVGYPYVSIAGNVRYDEFNSFPGFKLRMKTNPEEEFTLIIFGYTEESTFRCDKIQFTISRRNLIDTTYKVCGESNNEEKLGEFIDLVEVKINESKVAIIQPATATESTNPINKYDVFVSHASANKADFVEGLVAELKKVTDSVWYDVHNIDWGDDILKKILDGLDKTEFAIVVFSKEFFGREWTEFELEKLLNKQNEKGIKIVLPILYDCTSSDFTARYPKLSRIKFIEAKDYNIQEITIMFAKMLIKRLKGIE